MKKALALVLALVLALSLGVTAFAASINVNDNVIVINPTEGSTSVTDRDVYTYADATYGWGNGNTYKLALADVNLGDYDQFQITYIGGTEFAKATVDAKKKELTVQATPAALIEKGELEFSIKGMKATQDANGKVSITYSAVTYFNFKFDVDPVETIEVGYKVVDFNTVTTTAATEIKVNAFVITADQFKAIKGAALTIKAPEFVITNTVAANQGAINFKYNTTVADAVKKLNSGANIAAVNFIGAQTFGADAKITFSNKVGAWLSLGDIIDHTGDETVYVYDYAGGKLALIGTVDANKGDIAVTVKAGETLGSIYLSDKALVDGTEKEEPKDEGKDNVDTGANDVVSVAAALAVVSLVAAGAVACKKVSK